MSFIPNKILCRLLLTFVLLLYLAIKYDIIFQLEIDINKALLHKSAEIFSNVKKLETLTWLVQIDTSPIGLESGNTWIATDFEVNDGDDSKNLINRLASEIAQELNLINCGPSNTFRDWFLFAHPDHKTKPFWPGNSHSNEKKINWYRDIKSVKEWKKTKEDTTLKLKKHPLILNYEQQFGIKRSKRANVSKKDLKKDKIITINNKTTSIENSSATNLYLNKNNNYTVKSDYLDNKNNNNDNIKINNFTIEINNKNNTNSIKNKVINKENEFSNLWIVIETRSIDPQNSNDKWFPIHFNDPYFNRQWHLRNAMNPGQDMNVMIVWAHNITGRGVTVAVIDDGLDWNSTDIKGNYNPAGSYDAVSNDNNPSPSHSKDTNHHGTRCAGEIAATANNSFCGVGLAYNAKVSGIRLIDGPMTDEAEARAFLGKLDVNDVYSCSWGPDDDGKTLDGPHKLAFEALRLGTDYGRNGYGSIYVVASGNGGRNGDNCNYDGYANSVFTVTIGAVDERGEMPDYSEQCASMLAVAYSSGNGKNIVTSDWMMYGSSGCTENHSGTSASAPLAAGIIALMLEANPCLTWRDVQYLIALTAVKIDIQHSLWSRNMAGLHHSHQHGFGKMDAWRSVNAAKAWQSIPWLTLFTSDVLEPNTEIRSGHKIVTRLNVLQSDLMSVDLYTLEYVHLVLTLTHEVRGQIEIQVTCPSNTSSVLGATRVLDDSKEGFNEWIFSTVRCWGEEGWGTWTLIIIDHGSYDVNVVRGRLVRWQLRLYGSSMTSQEVQQRIRLVNEAAENSYVLNTTVPSCQPPPVQRKMVHILSERYLKVLVITGAFVFLMALYDTFEYALCYRDEKEDETRKRNLTNMARRLAAGGVGGDRSDHREIEYVQLLPLGDGGGDEGGDSGGGGARNGNGGSVSGGVSRSGCRENGVNEKSKKNEIIGKVVETRKIRNSSIMGSFLNLFKWKKLNTHDGIKYEKVNRDDDNDNDDDVVMSGGDDDDVGRDSLGEKGNLLKVNGCHVVGGEEDLIFHSNALVQLNSSCTIIVSTNTTKNINNYDNNDTSTVTTANNTTVSTITTNAS